MSLIKRPPRVSLIRIDKPDERIDAQLNPGKFTESGGAEWGHIKIPGYSSTVKQFANTKDIIYTVTFPFIAFFTGRKGVEQIKDARRKIRAWCRPRNVTSTISRAGAPHILFSWPNFLTAETVITDFKFDWTRFNSQMGPIEATLDLTLETNVDKLITADDDESSDPDSDFSDVLDGGATSATDQGAA